MVTQENSLLWDGKVPDCSRGCSTCCLAPFLEGLLDWPGGDWALDTGLWGCRELGPEGRAPTSTVFQPVLMSFPLSFEIATFLDRG